MIELSEMSYLEVLLRMVELMYVSAAKQAKLNAAADAAGQELPYPRPAAHQGRWLDPTFCSRVQLFAHRAQERCAAVATAAVGTSTQSGSASVEATEMIADNPEAALRKVRGFCRDFPVVFQSP